MREEYSLAGAVVRSLKEKVKPMLVEGTRLLDIAEFVERETFTMGAEPAFPCNISLNEVASHDSPSADDERRLTAGDLAKLDFGACVDGYIADAAFSYGVGTIAHDALIAASSRALDAGISIIRPGVHTSEVGRAIEASALTDGYRTLRGLIGHSMGRYTLHGGISIPNFDDGTHVRIKEGDVLAIEPFLTAGSGETVRLDKGNIYQAVRDNPLWKHRGLPFARRWLERDEGLESGAFRRFPVLVEKDGMPVAQAEHTVVVTDDGCVIIT